MFGHFHIAFFALAAVVLSVTGAEALYADMGHFGRKAITWGWLGLVLPALVLNYLGQGALLLGDQSVVSAPFFLLVPSGWELPMCVLATAATVIASQAVITGAYSVASQAAQLGYLPRLRVAHTSASSIGQIYVPWINGMLMVAVLILVFAFRSSAALGYAYGMAVTGTITITTLLFLYIAHARWRWPLWMVIVGGGALLTVDLMFLAANLTKLVHGAWFPLLIGLVTFTVLITWQRGSAVVAAAREKAEGPLQAFIGEINTHKPPYPRVPGTAVFLNRGTRPPHWPCGPTSTTTISCTSGCIILSIACRRCPGCPMRNASASTTSVTPMTGSGIMARFGYMERVNVPAALRLVDPA